MKPIIASALILLAAALPAAAKTPANRPINLIQMMDTPSGRDVKVVGSTIGETLFPEQLRLYDEVPLTLMKHGYLQAGEDYMIMYITSLNKKINRLMYVGNKGTALTVDFEANLACAIGVGESGPMAKNCLSLVR